MKRISVFLFFAFLVPSFKAMASVNFQSALQLYKDKQYEKAYEAFLILADSDYTNVDYNYYLARSAFFVKEYNEAISAYERILIQYPTMRALNWSRVAFNAEGAGGFDVNRTPNGGTTSNAKGSFSAVK